MLTEVSEMSDFFKNSPLRLDYLDKSIQALKPESDKKNIEKCLQN